MTIRLLLQHRTFLVTMSILLVLALCILAGTMGYVSSKTRQVDPILKAEFEEQESRSSAKNGAGIMCFSIPYRQSSECGVYKQRPKFCAEPKSDIRWCNDAGTNVGAM